MAGSISESFDNLKAQIDSLASSFKALGTGVNGRAKLESSPNFEKAVALVENNAFLTHARGVQSKSKDIQRAQKAMRSHPGKWDTPDEYLAYEKEQKERGDRLARRLRELNKERFERQQRLSDKILSIKSPKRYREMMLSREYGDVGASQIISAEQGKEQHERRDRLAKRERELRKERFDRQQEVSDKIMSIKSPDRYRKMMLSRKYGTSGADSIIAAEEAEEQRLRDSRRSISVRRYQVEAYRKFPWVKTLVDAGIIQKKELPKIAKSLSKTSNIPLIGSLLRNPGVGFAGLIAELTHLIGSSARAAGQVLPWKNLEIAGGTVSDDYKSLMASVGLGEKGAITSATKRKMLIAGWSRAQGLEAFTKGAYYGIMPTAGMFSMTHDQLLDYVSKQAYGISDDGMRLNALAAYGINEAEYSASIQRQGLQKKTTANYVSQAAQRSKDRKAKTVAAGGWWANITHPDWAIDFISSAMPNDPLHGKEWKRMLDEEQKAQRAAESAEEYERNKSSTHQSGNGEAMSAGNQVSFNINEVRVDADNYQEFIQSIASEAGMRYNIDVMKWADSRRVKV